MRAMASRMSVEFFEPKFHLTREDMQRLGDTATELLTDNVS